MRERPDGATLLALAAELEQQAPDERDRALIARARAIAAREQDAADAPLAACRSALVAYCGDGDCETQHRRRAEAIRAGRSDPPGPVRDAVRSLLWQMTVMKLRESNPDYLAQAGIG